MPRTLHPKHATSVLLAFALLGSASGCGPVAPGDDDASDQDHGSDITAVSTSRTYVLTGVPSGRCVDVSGGSKDNKANVLLSDCHGKANQQFRFQSMGDGTHHIINANSNKCLDVTHKSKANGANIQQYDCHTGDNQRWRVTDVGGGAVRLTALHSGKAIDANANGTSSGTNLIQYSVTGGKSQMFYLKAVDDGSSGSSSSCDDTLQGWAATDGSTTGGKGGSSVTVSSSSDLKSALSGTTARIVKFSGTISGVFEVGSNKTLLGVGSSAKIKGTLLLTGSKNVILKNFEVDANNTPSSTGDGISITDGAQHIWVDHCSVHDAPDGNLDIKRGSDRITVSWTKFFYTRGGDHRFSNLVGHSDDNASQDRGKLNITFHHNWWAGGVTERMPRIRFGKVHVYNNYFSSSGSSYCVRAGREAHILIESNYFEGVRNPHEFNNSTDKSTAFITARNNTYKDASGDKATGGGGSAFSSAPYSTAIDRAVDVPTAVKACVGPR